MRMPKGAHMTDEIIQKALRLKELDKLIIKAIATSDIDHFAEHIVEFNTAKKLIRSYGLAHPLVNMQEIEDQNVHLIIQKVISGEPFSVEKALSGSTIEEFLKGELDENEIEKIGSDLFCSWFSHYEYIQGLYEIGALAISCGKVPENLSKFVNEARHCYTFQQFNAVFSLCRTILEVCIKDVATICKILPADMHNIRQTASHTPDLYDLINQLSDQFTIFAPIRGQLHKVRRETNYIIHGNRLVKKEKAKDILKETLLVIHRLYELESTRQGRT
jgi:hypothetical protein